MKTMIHAALVALLAAVTVAERIDLQPLDDPALVASVGEFPVPVEMRRRQISGSRSSDSSEPTLSTLTKRHYGSFVCSNTQLNNYCKQFVGDEGVGSYVGCADNTCYVGCQVAGYTRTNDPSQICVNYNTDENNCGSFGTTCPAVTNGTPACSGGSCTATCANGYTLTSGQCINQSTDINNCGGAGVSCAARAGTGYVSGSAVCRAGSCSVSCSTGYTAVNGVCTRSYQTDPANCGSAGNNCATNAGAGYLANSASCTGGKCSFSCQSAYTSNGATCVSKYASDPANCGTSGNNCATNAGPGLVSGSATCSNGQCSVTCQSGYTNTNGVCVSKYNSDVANCGSAGNNCATNAGAGLVAGSAICTNGKCSFACQSSYTNNGATCVSKYASDATNCGTAGNNCANNAGTGYLANSATCNNGVCSVSCQSGYAAADGKTCTLQCKDGAVLISGNKCGRITGCSTNADCVSQTGSSSAYCYLSSDGNACFSGSSNAGGLPTGSACGWSANPAGDDNQCATGLVCLNHVCSPTTTNDPSNCGSSGNVCPTPANGSRTCQAGKCGITCNSGFTASGTTCVNTSNDPKNCGTAGTVCSASGSGVASATCVSSKCRVTCQSGYTASADGQSCSSTCKDGTTFNGSTCVRYSCSTNAQCNSQTGRTDSACYNGQCVTLSSNSGGLPEGRTCGTTAVSPGDDNQCAAGLVCVYNTCYNPNRPTACGANQINCPVPANGIATCNIGTCGITCNTNYLPNTAGTACVLNPSSKPKKKRAQHALELCPAGETACPIAGSASFGSFVGSSDRTKEFGHSAGGFECIDTTSDLQSCGGCASMRTGVDCTRIAHTTSVGCSNGTCVVLSCRKGWALSIDQKQCVKSEASGKEQRTAHLRQRALKRKNQGVSH